jgi:hypothetical protein
MFENIDPGWTIVAVFLVGFAVFAVRQYKNSRDKKRGSGNKRPGDPPRHTP